MDKKVLDRVEKLIRLAAPSSNTTIEERQSAALEACKIIAENDLTVKPKEEKKKRTRHANTYSQPQAWGPQAPWGGQAQNPPQGWARSRAARDGWCEDPECRGPIAKGDQVWARIIGFDTQYLHLGGDCGW